ncbi:MAG TPA: GAF domain-containing protein [Terriglobales bacterium]|nr:GAF domain-containing protein [Terriglobales bacterium]
MRPPSSPGSASEAFDAALRLIAEQAQMLTLASGAAIALRQGELMLCYARAGDGAPALGAQLDTQSGLSGECVRTARTLLCEDTENDPRVNLDVCRYLGIRSIVVLPICLDREVVGVFEAFSAQPGAFSANEMAALESMRDLVVSVIRPEPPAEAPAPSALGAIIAGDELPLTPLRRAESNSPPAPFRPVRNWPLETSRPDQNLAPPVRAAEAAPPVPHQQQETPSFRPVAGMPPLAHFQPPISPEAEDDLICELEQRESAAPESEAESLKRAFQLFDSSSAQPAPPRTPVPPSSPILPRSFAPPAAPDPDDDLICEIEARSIPPAPMVGEPHPAHANAFSAFTPAPVRPPEHQVSRKLIVAGVVVALGGLLWLRWCNHAQQVKGPATPANTVQAAVPPAPPPTPAATASQSAPSTVSGTSTARATSSQPAASAADTPPPEEKLTSTEEASDSPPPQAARSPRPPVSVLRGQKRVPARPQTQTHERAALEKTGSLAPAPSTSSSATLASPPPNVGQPAPRAFTAPPAEQLRAAAVPANPPPQTSPPPFTLKPAPAPAVSPPPAGQLSLSQAVVKSSPESPAADTLSPDALRLLLDSAKAGDAGAQLALALRYANGDGVRQSYPEAFKWFTRAQAQGAVPRQGQAAQVWGKVQQWAQSHPQKK